jgi:NTE family protein
MEDLTSSPEIEYLVGQTCKKGLDRKIYSDITDRAGNQYIDLVQEGGGVLGIALAGYTWILEKCGIRFFSLAGTSAGAINTLLMASLARIGEPVSGKVIDIFGKADMSAFVDGHPRIQELIWRYTEDRPFFKFFVFLNSFRIWRVLKRNLGLNPGTGFERWLEESLATEAIETLSDLERARGVVPELFDRCNGNAPITRVPALQIIASDITTKTKVVFPEMAELYWRDPDQVNPAKFVRASMSIPFFFYPYLVENIPGAGTDQGGNPPGPRERWRRYAGYYGEIPPSVYFVDGGLLSNFPINAFHITRGIPKKPTFGVKLSAWRKSYSKITSPGNMTSAMVATMRQLHDYDFLVKNPDYNRLICHIDADTGYNWLDFGMDAGTRSMLFLLGAEKAVEFLERFDWEEYKKIREKSRGI